MTVSLCGDTVQFLERMREESRAPSMSAVFETLVEQHRGHNEMQKLDSETKAYYDSLSDSERGKEEAWGHLGEDALASLAAEEARDHQASGKK